MSSSRAPLHSSSNPSGPKNKKGCNAGRPSGKKLKMAGVSASGGVRTMKAFAVVNRSAPHPTETARVAGSECKTIEFTKEDVEALLNVKMKNKLKDSLKEKCDHMTDYIRRLRQCIEWFRELEGNYSQEQEKLQKMVNEAETRCSEAELFMKNKEEELNAIIMELRKNYDEVQEKLTKEVSEKMGLMDSLAREKVARLASETLNTSLSEELLKYQGELEASEQMLSSIMEMHKDMKEYNSGLQLYNTKLQSEHVAANENLKRVEKEKGAIVDNLNSVRSDNKFLQEELASSRGLQAEAIKQREVLSKEVSSIRLELQQIRDDRDSQRQQSQQLTGEIEKYKLCTENILMELDKIPREGKHLEENCILQSSEMRVLQEQLTEAICQNMKGCHLRERIINTLRELCTNVRAHVHLPAHECVGYSAQGSGSTLITPFLDNKLKSPSPLLLPAVDAVTPLSEAEAVELVKSVFQGATERDIATGDRLETVVLRADGVIQELAPEELNTIIEH